MSYRVLSTPHLAELFHQPQLTEVAKSDWQRAGKFLRGEWPKPLPEIVEWRRLVHPDELYETPYLVIDTEYDRYTKDLVTLGIGGPGTPIYQWWPYKAGREDKEWVQDTLVELIDCVPVVFQNFFADLPVLKQNLDIGYGDFSRVDDLLILFALLWCELPHNLEFIASICGQHEKLKHLPMTDPRYNAGDIEETISGWEQATKEVSRDKGVRWIYENSMLPLIPIILEAQSLGIRVDRQAVKLAEVEFVRNRAMAVQTAEAYAGFPINLGSSQQMCQFLTYDLKRKKPLKSVDDDAVAELRNEILPFNPQEEVTIEATTSRIADGGNSILEARILFAKAQQFISHYVRPMLASPDGRVYPEFHPWAQNTGRWSTVDPPLAQLPASLRPALLPDESWEWVEFDWSGIELRLIAALTGDKLLQEAFDKGWDLHTVHMCQFFELPQPPDPTKRGIDAPCSCVKGEVEFTCDELHQARSDMVHVNTKWWQQNLSKGCAEAWRYLVGWQGSSDPRRTFAKAGVFRLCYGGLPESAPSIPGASSLQVAPSVLVAASKRWINLHRPIKNFWRKLQTTALQKRQLRTFLGRRWNFLSHDRKRILRQMYDFPMQGGVADIKNLTLIAIKDALGDRVRLYYEQHDSLKLGVKITECLEDDVQTIQKIAERLWDVNGTVVSFPVEMHRRRIS